MSLALYGNTCPRLAMATGQIGRWHRFMLLHENFNGQTPAASDSSNGKRSNSPRRRTPWPPINYDREARAIFAFRFLLQHVLLLSPIVFLFRVAKLDRLIRCGIPRHCFQTAADPYQHLPPRVCWWAHHTTTCINVAILRVTTFSLFIPFFYSFWTSFSWTSADTFFFSSLHRTCSDAFSLYLRVYNGLHDDQPLPTSLASSNTDLEAGEANKTRTTPTGPYEEKGLPPQPTARSLPPFCICFQHHRWIFLRSWPGICMSTASRRYCRGDQFHSPQTRESPATRQGMGSFFMKLLSKWKVTEVPTAENGMIDELQWPQGLQIHTHLGAAGSFHPLMGVQCFLFLQSRLRCQSHQYGTIKFD